jgi:quinol monooxygenase YgiN
MLEEAMREVAEATRRFEPGCMEYAFAADIHETSQWRLCELWAGEDALTAHFGTTHLLNFREVLRSMPSLCVSAVSYAVGSVRRLV